jgi:glycosyltransferase involved in cell wall biosynthesis
VKVLLIDNSPAMGGSIHQLASQVRGLRGRGVETAILASNPGLFDGLIPPDVPARTLPWPGFRDVFAAAGAALNPVLPGPFNKPFARLAYRRLRDALLPDFLTALGDAAPDIVHINNLNLPNKVFGDALVNLGRPFTVAAQMVRLFSRTEAAFAASARRVVCISRAVERCLRAQMPNVADGRYAIVPNGIDPRAFDAPADGAVWDEFGVPPGAPVVLSLGRLTEWKGHDVLVRAISKIPGAWLVQAGGEETAWRARMDSLAREVGVADRFVIAGVRADVPRLLAACAVLAHSSKYSDPRDGVVEAFGRVIIEAMAAGRPVVATDAGGAAEILTDETGAAWTHNGDAPGRLVPPGDAGAMAKALRFYLDDKDAARAAGAAGRVRVNDFDETKLAGALFDILEAARRVTV